MRRLAVAALATLPLTLLTVSSVSADTVTDWNLKATAAIKTAGIGPNPSTRALAITHIAIHDALVAISKAYKPYKTSALVPAGPASKDAAVAAAAHKVLADLFPGQKTALDTALQTTLDTLPDGAEKNNGVALGNAAADEILNLRALDGASAIEAPYNGATNDAGVDGGTWAPGQWRPTARQNPEAGAPLPGADPQWRKLTPFAITSPDAYRAPAPYGLTTPEYLADFNEVKALGAFTGSTRTSDQSIITPFWVQNTNVPINEIARTLSAAKGLTIDQNGYLFAVVNIALADVRIAIWDSKYFYNFWRPITAINLGDPEDGGTTADPTWAPYIETPNHPEYPSGHSGTGAAGIAVLKLYFGDTQSITVNSDSLAATQRSFTKLSDVVLENGLSRIYGGIHFQHANLAGQELGNKVGQYVFANLLTPLATDGGVADAADGGSDAADGAVSDGGVKDATAATDVIATEGGAGGSAGAGGSSGGAGGTAGAGGTGGGAGTGGAATADASVAADGGTPAAEDDSGCSCRIESRPASVRGGLALIALGALFSARRRRSHRRSPGFAVPHCRATSLRCDQTQEEKRCLNPAETLSH